MKVIRENLVKALSVIALLCVLSPSIGCGRPPTLSRATAKEALEVMVNRKQWTAEFGAGRTVGGDATRNVANVAALSLYLGGTGLIADGSSSMCPIRLTEAGSKEYTASHWECEFSDASCGGGGYWVDSCEIPVTSELQVEVTGIRLDGATHALVEYTLTGVLSGWGQPLQKVTQMAGGLPVIAPGMLEPQDSRAAFQLYDDGWRVVNAGQ